MVCGEYDENDSQGGQCGMWVMCGSSGYKLRLCTSQICVISASSTIHQSQERICYAQRTSQRPHVVPQDHLNNHMRSLEIVQTTICGPKPGELAEGPGVVDSQRCGGFLEHVMFLLYSAHILRIYGRYLMLEGCPKSSF